MADPYEFGRIAQGLENLKEGMVKLEAKMDLFLKESIHRREFESLEKRVEEIAQHTNAIQSKIDKSSWVSDSAKVFLMAAISAAVAYFIS